MKILLTGQNGQIGSSLAQHLLSLGEVISLPRIAMDLSDLDQVRDVIRAVRPDLIVNPAAYTNVARAETEPALAMLVNGDAPGVMAQEAQRLGAAMIQYSTDYVFDGSQSQPYAETALPNPLNVYGATKLAGEQAVARHCETYWILRTSWIYSVQGANFMNTVVRLAQEQSQLTMVNDQFGAPTWAKTVSRVTRDMLLNNGSNTAHVLSHIRATTGLYHLSAGGETSWYEFASLIVDHLRARRIPTKISGSAAIMQTATGATPPLRPKNSRLALDKLESTFKVRVPHWRTDAIRCLDEIIDNAQLVHMAMREAKEK